VAGKNGRRPPAAGMGWFRPTGTPGGETVDAAAARFTGLSGRSTSRHERNRVPRSSMREEAEGGSGFLFVNASV
jgi:hypothetical protein